jgi:hypothetical protein
MINLELVRGPLPSDQDYQTICAEYARLTQSRVSEPQMHHWCKDSPAGPALHALLRTDEGRIVGHTCIFPFPIEVAGKRVTGGKTEYLFVHEDFRRQPVRGMEASPLPASILMMRQLYRHASEQLRWDPILASARPGADGIHQAAGCRPMMFPLFECLLIRRPWNACRFTPNLSRPRRLALFFLGLPQTWIWAPIRLLLLPLGRNIKSLPMDAGLPSSSDPGKAQFSSDPHYLSWRYPGKDYQRFGLANGASDFVIDQKGSSSRYVRICQSNLDSPDFPVLPLIVGLMKQARSCHALGIRWAIYDNGRPPAAVVNKLRRLGFWCARRQRKILIYTRHKDLVAPSRWSFDDSLVSYD